MSAWVLALGLSAGYLVRQNLAMQKRLEIASAQVEECNKSEATQEIRRVKKTIPPSDRFSEMNEQLPQAEKQMLQRGQESALEPSSPTMNTAPPGPRLFAPINEADDDIAADATPTGISGACSASARHRSRGGQEEEEAEVGISDLWDF